MTAVIVEDVVTSGGLELWMPPAIWPQCSPHPCFDRLEGGREAIEAAGLRLETLVTVRDLGIMQEV